MSAQRKSPSLIASASSAPTLPRASSLTAAILGVLLPMAAEAAQDPGGEGFSMARARAAANPTDAGLQCELAEAAMDAGKVDLGVDAAERCVKLAGGVARYQLTLSHAYLEKAQAAGGLGGLTNALKGKAAAERAVEIDPSYLPARVMLLNYHLQAPGIAGGRRREAKRQAEEIARRDPVLGVWARLRVLDEDAGDEELQAIHEAAAPLIGTPTDSNRTAVSTAIAAATRVHSDVLRERLISGLYAQHPGDPSVRYSRARLWILQGRNLDQAEAILTEYISAAELPPDAPSKAGAHWRLGQAYEMRGDRDAAIEHYRSALEIRPSFDEAKADLERLTKG